MAEMLDLSDQEFFKIMITILRAFTEKAENIQEQKDNVNREMNILRKGPKQMLEGISLAVQWLRLRLSMQGVQIRSLVGELRSHMPPGQKNKNIKQKQYCSKFNKDFKKVHIKKIFKKKC